MSRIVRFDHVAVAEMEAGFLGPSATLSAQCVFVSRQNGASYGHSKITRWSAETQAKLLELRALMERDLAELFFEDTEGTPLTKTLEKPMISDQGGGGIGERFSGDADAPQG